MSTKMTITRRKLGGSTAWVAIVLFALVALIPLLTMTFPGSLVAAWIPLLGVVIAGFGSEKVELDLEAKRYRTFFSFFGSRGGRYKPLPELDHVLIRAYYTRHYSRIAGSYRSNTTAVELSLAAKEGGHLVLRWAEYKKDVMELAQDMSRMTGLRVVDTAPEE